MIIEAIIYFILASLMFIFTVVFSAMCVSLRAKLTGRYLNRYFIVSSKGSGVYELHHHPFPSFYNAGERKFYRLLCDAQQKFGTGFPNMTLSATSFTLQSRNRKGFTLSTSGFRLLGARVFADMMILTNLANYRKVSGEWYFIKLIRIVHRRRPKRFLLIGG
ncbi:hypothetical protein [Paenibacillus gansuensis]|uniref:Uncharacterized protein n=1 Tax=Paenibacillus gansuensis TaxID=306542 RepID=A0ABW5PH78_9BACL